MKNEKLIYARKLVHISQEELASKIGMEQTTYSRKERGISPIYDDEWEKLSKILNFPIDQIKETRLFDSKTTRKIKNSQKKLEYVSIPLEAYDFLIKYISVLENRINIFK